MDFPYVHSFSMDFPMFHSFSVEKNDFTRPNSLQELVAEYTEIPEKMAAVARAEVTGFPSHHPFWIGKSMENLCLNDGLIG
jgi:hypothetical protein